jgi:hypothetical protein
MGFLPEPHVAPKAMVFFVFSIFGGLIAFGVIMIGLHFRNIFLVGGGILAFLIAFFTGMISAIYHIYWIFRYYQNKGG